MSKNRFKQFLEKEGKKDSTVRSYVCAVKRVAENYSENIGKEIDIFECEDLIIIDTIAKEYGIGGKYADFGNKNNATNRNSIASYYEYVQGLKSLESNEDGHICKQLAQLPLKNNVIQQTVKQKKVGEWPKWNSPNEEEVHILAKIITKYIRFLNPEIVAEITKNNNNDRTVWVKALELKNIDPELYLWEGSPCCFPGIRRHAGSKEIALFRKHRSLKQSEIIDAIEDAIILDDNDFPKQVWSFVLKGKYFAKSGPESYALAHLTDHKKANNRMKEEYIFNEGREYIKPFYGLFTCPTNTVYIPNNLIRPTDFNSSLRRLIVQKSEELYRNVCNIIPPHISIPKMDEKWSIQNFEWSSCVGNVNHVKDFLKYRKETVSKLLGL